MKASKNIYLLVSDCGDGSYSISYVLDSETLTLMEKAYDEGLMDYDAPGVDGDGFSYRTMKVPEDWTALDMGLSEHCVHTYDEIMEKYFEQD